MRIILANKFNHLRGGADRYFMDLTQRLREEGHTVAIFCMDHPKNEKSEYEKYFVSRVSFTQGNFLSKLKAGFRIFYSFEAKKKFSALIEDFKPDIIHFHNIYHQLSPSIVSTAHKAGIPTVIHLHDYKLMCPNYQMFSKRKICESCKGGKYYRCALKKCLKGSYLKSALASLEMYFHHTILRVYESKISAYIAPSEFMRQKAISYGFDSHKIIILPYFLNEGFIGKNTGEELSAPEKGDGKILFYGRISREKGIMTLLYAYKMIEKETTASLQIVGEGEQLPAVKREIGRLGLENRVKIHDAMYGEELLKSIKSALFIVVPSEWYEVSGIVNMEAAALGKPVIASDIGGIGEIVENAVTGYLFKAGDPADLADCMKKLTGDKRTAEILGLNAARSAEKYYPDIHLKHIMSIYSDIINHK